MRILYLIPSLSGGGAQQHLSYLAPALSCMGHEVHIAYSTGGPCEPEFPGVVLHKLKSRSNYDPHLLWQLVRLSRRIKPDIIQTWLLQMDILGGLAARFTGVVWILSERSSGPAYPTSWKRRLRIQLGSGACAIISNARGGGQYWETHLPYSRRYVVPNGLPVLEIERVKTALPVGLVISEAPIVLYVGRIVAHKIPKASLEALSCVRQQQDVVGILCGEGPHRSELEVLRHKLGLDACFYFTGYLPTPSVWALMKRASVFVSLSAYEGCPNAVMEAMSCGCPLVLSDIPAHREILDESTALFVDPTNVRQTAEAIVQTLRNTEASKGRALSAKQRSQEWTIAEMARNYEKVYKEVYEFES